MLLFYVSFKRFLLTASLRTLDFILSVCASTAHICSTPTYRYNYFVSYYCTTASLSFRSPIWSLPSLSDGQLNLPGSTGGVGGGGGGGGRAGTSGGVGGGGGGRAGTSGGVGGGGGGRAGTSGGVGGGGGGRVGTSGGAGGYSSAGLPLTGPGELASPVSSVPMEGVGGGSPNKVLARQIAPKQPGLPVSPSKGVCQSSLSGDRKLVGCFIVCSVFITKGDLKVAHKLPYFPEYKSQFQH